MKTPVSVTHQVTLVGLDRRASRSEMVTRSSVAKDVFVAECFLAAFLACATHLHAASTIQFSATSDTVPERAGTVTLTVRRTNDVNSVVSVDYTTADGTATNGLKYTAMSGTLAFAAGETNQAIVVPILNEGLVEGTKYFRVRLSNPSPGAVLGTRVTATVSIVDTDVGIQFQFANYNAANGWSWAEDVGTVLLGVVRGDDANLAVTVDLATSDLTATNGVDYVGFTNTLSFAPTERLKFVPVTILNDGLKETATKSFLATLSNPVGVSLGTTKTTTVTILDNDQGFQFETNQYTVAEDAGAALISVLRGTDDTNGIVTVDLATADVTATNGLDYTGVTNTLSFQTGERRKVVPIPILNDGIKESTKKFQVTLSHPTGGAALGTLTTTTVSVLENDPGLGFEAASYTTAWGQAADFAVTVLRGNDGALGPIAVDYATSDGTAKAGENYQGVSGRLEFQENETVKSLSIPILKPRAAGSAKTFRVTLSNPTSGVSLGTASTSVSIQGAYATVAPPFDAALTIQREYGVNVLTWSGGGTLQRADTATGPWQTLANAKSPCAVDSPVPTTFYRVTCPRPVSLYIPSNHTGQSVMPLVIMLHGYYGSSGDYESGLQIEPLAEARGFLYCRPQGTMDRFGYGYWNGTDAGSDFYNTGVDDASYLRSLIEEIERRFAVDRNRVHLFGALLGGNMAYRMACESADLIAGIGSVSGATFLDTDRCQPSEPVNILDVHPTAEEELSYFGGALGPSLPWPLPANMPPFPGALRSVQIWAAYNGAGDPVTDAAPTLDLSPALTGRETVVTRYTRCPPGGAIELWSIIGGTHGTQLSPTASQAVIDWLLAHPKP